MSQGDLCHLCVKIGKEHKHLYDEDGDENENYDLIMKYFDPQCLFRGKELELTTVCLSCWGQIYGFYNFQESVYEAQKNLLDNSIDNPIKLKIESPQEEKGNDLIEKQEINIKNEQEFLSEDECVLNSDMNIVEGFAITEICLPAENKYEPIESVSAPLNRDIYFAVEENSAITLPKLEIMDAYSTEDSSEDALSDEYDDQDASYIDDNSIEKDDSMMDITPAKEHVGGNFSKHLRTKKGSTVSLKESDDFIAQWRQSLQCELCSEPCTTYSLLRQHFHDNHPLEKCCVTCCERMFYHRCRLEDHIRIHINPNALKCDLCYKQFKEERYLQAHMRRFHSKENESKRKNAYKKKMEDVEMDELMAHDDFADHVKVCLQCVVCAEVAPTYSLLRQHFQTKHPEEKFYILCCQQKLSSRYRIEYHVRLHIDPNAFKCDLCDKQFKEGRYLVAHKRSRHNDINDEAKKPSSKKTKTDEEKTTTIKKAKTDKNIDDLISQWRPNLECVVCKQVCNTLTLLHHHFQENHPQKQLQIECCQRIFKRRYVIEEHIRLHINPDAFKCELCSSRFSRRTNLLTHMRSKHPSSGSE